MSRSKRHFLIPGSFTFESNKVVANTSWALTLAPLRRGYECSVAVRTVVFFPFFFFSDLVIGFLPFNRTDDETVFLHSCMSSVNAFFPVIGLIFDVLGPIFWGLLDGMPVTLFLSFTMFALLFANKSLVFLSRGPILLKSLLLFDELPLSTLGSKRSTRSSPKSTGSARELCSLSIIVVMLLVDESSPSISSTKLPLLSATHEIFFAQSCP
mmetsp:Transcript_24276/g.67233  ORF Transcript_24276/g.67233 Transcript_24276/m.67233 type:complete len:211 (+) Transcript_24276:42-674(+)